MRNYLTDKKNIKEKTFYDVMQLYKPKHKYINIFETMLNFSGVPTYFNNKDKRSEEEKFSSNAIQDKTITTNNFRYSKMTRKKSKDYIPLLLHNP